jgi:hypothetical protein
LGVSRPLTIVIVPRDQPALDLLLLAGELDASILPRQVFQLSAVALVAQRRRTARCDKQACGDDENSGTLGDTHFSATSIESDTAIQVDCQLMVLAERAQQ